MSEVAVMKRLSGSIKRVFLTVPSASPSPPHTRCTNAHRRPHLSLRHKRIQLRGVRLLLENKTEKKKKSCSKPGSKSSSSSAVVEIYYSDPAAATALFVLGRLWTQIVLGCFSWLSGWRKKKYILAPAGCWPIPIPMYITFMWSPFQTHIRLVAQDAWFIPLDINDCTVWFRDGVSEGKTGGRGGGSWDENASLWGVTRTDRRRNEFIRVIVHVR